MARIFMDGFESGGLDFWQITATTVINNSLSGRSGSYCLSTPHGQSATYQLPTSKSAIYLAVKHQIVAFNNDYEIVRFYNGSTLLADLRCSSYGVLSFIRYYGTNLGSSPIIQSGVWCLLEIYYLPHISNGTVIVKENGITVITATGIQTSASTSNITAIRLGADAGANYWDDFILDDANWIGPSSIQGLVPTGAGATTGFTATSVQTSVYSDSGYSSYSYGTTMDLRTLLPASEISASGSVIQLTLKNGSGSTVLGGCSIGERSGTTFDFASAPTRVTFGGSNTLSMASNGEYVSDSIAFALDETKSYLVHIYLSSTPYYTYKSKGSNYCADKSNGGDDTLVLSSSGYTERTQAYSVIELKVGEGNSACVNEIPASDADYIYTNTPDDVDTYACGNLTGTINSVKAVQVQARCMQEGSPAVPKIQLVARPTSTDRVSASKDVQTFAPKSVFSIWETNPDDAGAWSEADVNGMEIGVKAVAS